MAVPLNKRLEKGKPAIFELKDEKQQAVDDLKENLTTPPIFALPRPEGSMLLRQTLATNMLGACLYKSRTMTKFDP